MAYANVTGVGVGFREVAGVRRAEVCIRVYVSRKLPRTELSRRDLLPRAVDGVLVDVIEAEFHTMAADLSLSMRRTRHPIEVPGGVSVGGLRVTAGTLGASVSDLGNGAQLVLSNWHVLCGDLACSAGDVIIQPGVYDGGQIGDAIGYVHTFALTEDVDAACAAVNLDRYVLRDIAGLPGFRGVGAARLGSRIWKSGRTTGVTTGIVDDIAADVTVGGYPGGARTFRDQMIASGDDDRQIVAGGDSGSLVVDDDGYAVGLLFGGEVPSGTYFIANQIAAVIEALDIELPVQQTHVEVAGTLS
jgi:hypothetical protein